MNSGFTKIDIQGALLQSVKICEARESQVRPVAKAFAANIQLEIDRAWQSGVMCALDFVFSLPPGALNLCTQQAVVEENSAESALQQCTQCQKLTLQKAVEDVSRLLKQKHFPETE